MIAEKVNFIILIIIGVEYGDVVSNEGLVGKEIDC